jgi:hypothetical protein
MTNLYHPRLRWAFGLALTLVASASTMLSPRAFAADITVASPASSINHASNVLITAHNTGCEGLAPVSFGYSIDHASTIAKGESPYDIDTTISGLSAGTHIIEFKSSTNYGQCPTVTSTFTVAAASSSTQYTIPSYAVSSGDLDGSDKWTEQHDGGTPGSSRGSMVYPATTPLYDDARKFYMTYTDQAGERWSNQFVRDTTSTNFVLDTYVYLPVPSELMNLELDINQTLADGQTIILSTQCSGKIGYWEYGDTVGSHDHWKSTNIKCNPADWKANTWHHVQIGEHRDANGFVTHDWVALDGVYQPFSNATLESAHYLGWTPGDTNAQFQIEGSSLHSGTVTAYIHKFTVYRWK